MTDVDYRFYRETADPFQTLEIFVAQPTVDPATNAIDPTAAPAVSGGETLPVLVLVCDSGATGGNAYLTAGFSVGENRGIYAYTYPKQFQNAPNVDWGPNRGALESEWILLRGYLIDAR